MAPVDLDALHLQAYLEYSVGDFAEAARLLRAAIEAQPNESAYQFDLGLTYWQSGDLARSRDAFLRAAHLNPAHSEASYNAALASELAGDSDGASRLYRQAYRANFMHVLHRVRDRVRSWVGRSDPRALERGAWRVPTRDIPTVRCAIAFAQLQLGEIEQAVLELEKVIALDPTPSRHAMLAPALARLGRLDDAEKHLQAALARAPNSPDYSEQIAQLYQIQKRYPEERKAYEKLLAHRPNDIVPLTRLLALDTMEGRLEEAEARHRHLIDVIDDRKLKELSWEPLASILYRAIMWPLPPQKLKALEQAIDDKLADKARRRGLPLPTLRDGTPGRRLRIGYLSANLRNHPIGHVTADFFGAHDRAKFETFVFHASHHTSEHTDAARKNADHFFTLLGKLSESIKLIHSLELDLLIYLDGYMTHQLMQIVAARPAARQAYWLGHAGHCALSSIDYLITDRIVLPPEDEKAYRVKIVRLPDTYHCAARERIGPPMSRKKAGLPEAGFVFCAFNNPEKIDQKIFGAWMRIMAKIPGSLLWLSRGPSQEFEIAMKARAATAGIEGDRLVFATRLPDKKAHLSRHRLAGLFLDTTSLNASTTALDALWAGLPLLTVRGTTYASRIASSMLTALGMEDMICDSLDAYEREAIRLATNPEALTEKRERLARNRDTHPLFDMRVFARNFEAAIESMCRNPPVTPSRRSGGDHP